MTKTEKLILTIVGATILTIFGIGATDVFGETFEDTISFPIPPNITGMEKRGTMSIITEDVFEMQYTFKFYLGQNGTAWFESLIEQFGLDQRSDDISEEETPGPIYYGEVPEEFEPFVKDLIDFENEPPTTPSEIDYYEQLKFLQMCYRQTEQNQQSLGVTQSDGFAVSNLWIQDYGELLKAFQITGNSAILQKAIEECKYIHTILNPVTLGVEYQNRAKYFNNTQVYHGDLAADIPTWSQERVNTESNDRTEKRNVNPICLMGSYFSDQTKRMYCGDDYTRATEDPLTEERTKELCNSMFVTQEFKIRSGCSPYQIAIPCYSCGKESPIVESEALDNYFDYLNNGDSAQLEQAKRKLFAEQYAKLRGYTP